MKPTKSINIVLTHRSVLGFSRSSLSPPSITSLVDPGCENANAVVPASHAPGAPPKPPQKLLNPQWLEFMSCQITTSKANVFKEIHLCLEFIFHHISVLPCSSRCQSVYICIGLNLCVCEHGSLAPGTPWDMYSNMARTE